MDLRNRHHESDLSGDEGRTFTSSDDPAFYLLLFFLSLISGYFLLVLIRGFIELTLQFGANPEAVNLHFHERLLPHLSSRLRVFLLVIPLVTMRSIAGERSQGSFELIASSGLRPWQYILGKTFAMDVLVILLILPVAVQGLLLKFNAEQGSAFDTPGFILSLIGLFLLGRSFAGVGLAISAMTRSPTLAAGATFFLLLLAWVLASAGGGTGLLAQILPEISPLTRLENFAIGRFVVADLLFFLVVMIASFVFGNSGCGCPSVAGMTQGRRIVGLLALVLLISAPVTWLVSRDLLWLWFKLLLGLGLGGVWLLAALRSRRHQLQGRGFIHAFTTSLIVVGLLVIGGVGVAFSQANALSFDLTDDQVYTLAPQTQALLQKLPEKTHITAYFKPGGGSKNYGEAC